MGGTKEIRNMIYTTDMLEGFYRQLRKFTKIRIVFPIDELHIKSLNLVTDQVIKNRFHLFWLGVLSFYNLK